MSGYILTSKSLPDSPIWNKPPLYLKVWMYLLVNACYSDVGNLKRGQILTSIPEIQEACTYYVGYRKVTPTYKEVRSVIDFLRNPDEGNAKGNMIVTTKVTHGFIATICNYEVYQDPKSYEGHNEGRTKDVRRARQGQNKKNEDIKNKKEKEYISVIRDEFEKLWEIYPKKQGKKAALKSYEKAREDGAATYEQIRKGMEDYIAFIKAENRDMQYVKQGSTFFSQEAWRDDWSVKENGKRKTDFRGSSGDSSAYGGGTGAGETGSFRFRDAK